MNKVIVSTCIHPNQARESSLKMLLTINKIRIALFIILAFTQPLLVFADPVKKPESEISERSGSLIALQVCSGCHGKTGQSISNQYPHLAGQQKAYLRIQLAQFKEHLRKSANSMAFMWIFGGDLSAQQIDELAEYYSAQVPMKGEKSDSPLVRRGEQIYTEGIPKSGVPPCTLCHQKGAVGRAEIPRLAGQHANYLNDQMIIFKHTQNRPNGQAMMVLTHDISDTDIRAVSNYLGSLNSSE